MSTRIKKLKQSTWPPYDLLRQLNYVCGTVPITSDCVEHLSSGVTNCAASVFVYQLFQHLVSELPSHATARM